MNLPHISHEAVEEWILEQGLYMMGGENEPICVVYYPNSVYFNERPSYRLTDTVFQDFASREGVPVKEIVDELVSRTHRKLVAVHGKN
jgi:hypothetical protein